MSLCTTLVRACCPRCCLFVLRFSLASFLVLLHVRVAVIKFLVFFSEIQTCVVCDCDPMRLLLQTRVKKGYAGVTAGMS